MQHVFALLEEAAEELLVLARADGRRLGLGTIFHRLVKLVEGNRLSQVICIFNAIDVEVEEDALETKLLDLLGRQVNRRLAAQDII